MISLGVDPDTQCSGIALVCEGKVLAIGAADITPMKLKGAAAAVAMCNLLPRVLLNFPWQKWGSFVVTVEAQQHYMKAKARGDDLMLVSAVAGSALGAAGLMSQDVHFPKPCAWKGQVPKGAHQKRILEEVGWEYEWRGPKAAPVPKVPSDVTVAGVIPPTHMKEVVDAIGLALWGLSSSKPPRSQPRL